MREVTVAAVQQSCFVDRRINLEKSADFIQDAVIKGAELVVLQELHATEYFCQRESPNFFSLAESVPGATTNFFSNVAKENRVVLVLSLFEKSEGGQFYNTAVCIESDGSICGKYRKTHIPEDPGFHEKYYFEPGDLGITPITTSVGKLGVLVCWDQWFPEAARAMALAGAEILIYPTAIGWIPKDPRELRAKYLDAWITIQRAHAIANHLPLVCVNRVGVEVDSKSTVGLIEFWGNSFVTGVYGEVVAQAPAGEEAILISKIDLAQTDKARDTWPFLRDRREKIY